MRLFLLDTLPKGLDAAKCRLASFAKGLSIFGGKIFAGGSAILTPLVAAASQFANQGSVLNDLNAATGVSVEELSALKYAAEQSGGSLEGLRAGLRGLAKFTAQAHVGAKAAKTTLHELGISSAAFLSATPTQRLAMIADGLRRISDPSLRAAAAMKVLGKGGADLMPMLAGGAAGLGAMVDRAKQLGLIITGDEARKADELGDAWDDLKKVFNSVVFVTGAALADSLQTVFAPMITGAVATADFVRNNQELVVVLATAAAVAMAAGGTFLALAAVGLGLSGVMSGLNVILGLATGLWGILGTIKTMVAAVITWLTATLTAEGIAALVASIQVTLLNAATGLLAAISTGAAAAVSALGAALAFLISPVGILLLAFVGIAAAVIAGTVYFFGYTQAGRT